MLVRQNINRYHCILIKANPTWKITICLRKRAIKIHTCKDVPGSRMQISLKKKISWRFGIIKS